MFKHTISIPLIQMLTFVNKFGCKWAKKQFYLVQADLLAVHY